MAKVTMLNMAGAEVGSIDLNDDDIWYRTKSERCSCSSKELSG